MPLTDRVIRTPWLCDPRIPLYVPRETVPYKTEIRRLRSLDDSQVAFRFIGSHSTDTRSGLAVNLLDL